MTTAPATASVADQIREIVKTGHALGLLVSQKQAVKLLGYTEKTLETWRHAGNGPRFVANEYGRFLGYRLEALETWLREQEVQSTAEAKAKGKPRPERNRPATKPAARPPVAATAPRRGRPRNPAPA